MRAIVISLAFLVASTNARNLKDCFIQNDDGDSTYQCPGCQMKVDDQGHVSLLQGPDCSEYDIPAKKMADEATVQVPGCQRTIQGGQIVEELGPACRSLSARPWKTKGSSSFFGGSGHDDFFSETLDQVGSAISEGLAGLHKQPGANGLLSAVGGATPNRRCQTFNRGNGDTVVQCRACQVIIDEDGETKLKQGSGCSKYGKQIKKAKASKKNKKLGKSGKKGKKGKKTGKTTKSDGNGCTTTTDENGNEVTNCSSCQSVVTINGKTVVSHDCNSDITAMGDGIEASTKMGDVNEDGKKAGKKDHDDDNSDDEEDSDNDDDSDKDGDDDDDGDDDEEKKEKEEKEEKRKKPESEGKEEKEEGEEKEEEGGEEKEEEGGEKEEEGKEKEQKEEGNQEEKDEDDEKEDDKGNEKESKEKPAEKKPKSDKKQHVLRDVDFDFDY